MTKVPTLEEVAAQLEAQDADLAAAADLAEAIPYGLTVDESFREAIDDATEPPFTTLDPRLSRGIRA